MASENYIFKGNGNFMPDKNYTFTNKCKVILKNGTVLDNIQILNQNNTNKTNYTQLITNDNQILWNPKIKLSNIGTLTITFDIFYENHAYFNYWESSFAVYIDNVFKTTYYSVGNFNSRKITISNVKLGSVISFKSINVFVGDYIDYDNGYIIAPYYWGYGSIDSFTVNDFSESCQIIINTIDFTYYEGEVEPDYYTVTIVITKQGNWWGCDAPGTYYYNSPGTYSFTASPGAFCIYSCTNGPGEFYINEDIYIEV